MGYKYQEEYIEKVKEILNKQLEEAQRPLYDTAFHRGKRVALEEALENIDVINKSYVKDDKPIKK